MSKEQGYERILFVGGPWHGSVRDVVLGAQLAIVSPAYFGVAEEEMASAVAERAYRRAEALIKVPGRGNAGWPTMEFAPGMPVMLCEAVNERQVHSLALGAIMAALGMAKAAGDE